MAAAVEAAAIQNEAYAAISGARSSRAGARRTCRPTSSRSPTDPPPPPPPPPPPMSTTPEEKAVMGKRPRVTQRLADSRFAAVLVSPTVLVLLLVIVYPGVVAAMIQSTYGAAGLDEETGFVSDSEPFVGLAQLHRDLRRGRSAVLERVRQHAASSRW